MRVKEHLKGVFIVSEHQMMNSAVNSEAKQEKIIKIASMPIISGTY